MPNPGLPNSLKIIAGSKRVSADPVIDLPIIEQVPEPPEYLKQPEAVAEWKRLAPILIANKLLTEGGVSAFAMLCSLHGEIAQMLARQVTPSGHHYAQYRSLLNDFGLTPVAQGRLKVPEKAKGESNKFAKFGKTA